MDWRDGTDAKEKRHLYYCSEEWAAKRVPVIERCGNLCERCGLFPVYAVHHLTYIRLYDERTEDLQGMCEHCHANEHKKPGFNGFDPLENKDYIEYARSQETPVCNPSDEQVANWAAVALGYSRFYLAAGELLEMHAGLSSSGANRLLAIMNEEGAWLHSNGMRRDILESLAAWVVAGKPVPTSKEFKDIF
jgi:hypothetical protein